MSNSRVLKLDDIYAEVSSQSIERALSMRDLLRLSFKSEDEKEDEGKEEGKLNSAGLPPGQEALERRVINLIKKNRPNLALRLIQKALDRAKTPKGTLEVLNLAYVAKVEMKQLGWLGDMKELEDTVLIGEMCAGTNFYKMPFILDFNLMTSASLPKSNVAIKQRRKLLLSAIHAEPLLGGSIQGRGAAFNKSKLLEDIFTKVCDSQVSVDFSLPRPKIRRNIAKSPEITQDHVVMAPFASKAKEQAFGINSMAFKKKSNYLPLNSMAYGQKLAWKPLSLLRSNMAISYAHQSEGHTKPSKLLKDFETMAVSYRSWDKERGSAAQKETLGSSGSHEQGHMKYVLGQGSLEQRALNFIHNGKPSEALKLLFKALDHEADSPEALEELRNMVKEIGVELGHLGYEQQMIDLFEEFDLSIEQKRLELILAA